MDQIASKKATSMMMANLISEKDTEEYNYGVKMLLEKKILRAGKIVAKKQTINQPIPSCVIIYHQPKSPRN